jgi:predicted nucleic-acid-binding protein
MGFRTIFIECEPGFLVRASMESWWRRRFNTVQAAKATEILERRLTPKNPGFVSVVAMVETVWVLDRAYDLTAQEIAAAVERLLEVLAIENEQEVFTAMIALKQGRGSFADALIAELGARAGCTRTLTFDQKAVRHPGFELV